METYNTWIPDSKYWIPDFLSGNLDSELRITSSVGFWIQWAVFWNPKPRIQDSTTQISRIPDSHKQKLPVFRNPNSLYMADNTQSRNAKHWALSIQEKNPEISVGAKVEFLIGKTLFHLVVNPGTSRCPTVDLELVQTTRNVNGTRHSVRKFQPGKRAHLFRFSTFSGNFPVGRAYETCSIYHRTGNSGNFD